MSGAAPGVDSKWQPGKRGWMGLDNTVTYSSHMGPRNYRHEAKKIWVQLDVDKSGTVDQDEIEEWMMQHDAMTDAGDDVRFTIKRIFRDIDKDGNGTLDIEEFIDFYKTLQYEKNQMKYASLHYITGLPKAIVKFNKKDFTLEAIEQSLQDKIQQLTTQDKDRFRQILTMFKTQVQKSKDHDNHENVVMGVTQRQFQTVLMWLGLFATKEQAQVLFNKYDENGDGVLTVHEFLTKARPKDYPKSSEHEGEHYKFRTGKRMYLESEGPIRPMTPCGDVFYISENEVAARIRSRMANRPGVSEHYTDSPNAREDLKRIFFFHDKARTGTINRWQMERALGQMNISLGEQHLTMLMDRFETIHDSGRFDYNNFVNFVYPSQSVDVTLPMHTSLQLRKELPTRRTPRPLDFSRTFGAPSQPQARQGGRGSPSSRVSSQVGALLKPLASRGSGTGSGALTAAANQSLTPAVSRSLTPAASRSLTPAASVTELRTGRKGQPISQIGSRSSRSMNRSASTPQFVARAAVA